MTKVICSNCHREMKCVRQGVIVVSTVSYGPYELWNADELACPDCDIRVISRFGDEPFMRHFENGFKERITDIEARFPDSIRYWSSE